MLASLALLHQLRLRGSLTAAAEAVNLSRSAASHQLAALQRRLGVTLTERVGRGLRLTEAGLAVALQAERVLTEVERTGHVAERARGALAGTVVIATVQTIAVNIAPRLISVAQRRYPRLRLEIRDLTTELAVRAVTIGDADIAVVPEYDVTPLRSDVGLRKTHLFRDPVVIALPPQHRLARNRHAVDLADLAGDRWVTGAPGSFFGRLVPALCRQAGFDPDIAHRSDDYLVIAALVAAGHGVALLPSSARVHAIPVATRPVTADAGRDLVSLTRTSSGRPTVEAIVGLLTDLIGSDAADGIEEPAIET